MSNNSELKNTSYELFIICLSLLSLFNFAIYFLGASIQTDMVLSLVNYLISLIFLLDFLYRLLSTHHKSRYFIKQGGWADLLSSIPTSLTYIFRLVRLVRSYRQMKYLGNQRIIKTFIEDRANSALLVVSFLIILVMQFGSILILQAESRLHNSNIQSASDALWWTFVTITTVGYGDQFPVSNQGRIIGVLVMILGVGLFGVITGFLANAFLAPKKNTPDPVLTNQKLINELLEEVKDLKKLVKK